MTVGSVLDLHLRNLAEALVPYRRCEPQLVRWGTELAHRLAAGARLLVAGNGGSAAEAQHLTAELVGKLHHDRQPLSAIALHAETSALTAIANDYGYTDVYARQVRAHGRPGDVLLLLSTSGTSPNLLAAAGAARAAGLTTWALTGPAPNPSPRSATTRSSSRLETPRSSRSCTSSPVTCSANTSNRHFPPR
ncbi:hypothetical protein GCM10027614_75360 [Micromonospora vulcania]